MLTYSLCMQDVIPTGLVEFSIRLCEAMFALVLFAVIISMVMKR